MHKITLVTIGRLKENWAREACAFYADRLEHAVKLTIAELPASRETDPLRQVDDESRRLLKFIEDLDADVWVLDERGTALTSPAFAEIVASAKDAGRAMLFLLGGSYGLNDAVRAKGKRMRLSDMVLPHELCRVVFLEQLYRAMEIAKGSGYHH